MNKESHTSRLLRLKHVMELVGLSKTTIYSMQSAGTFPRAVQLTEKSVAWKESEVSAWMASRVCRRKKEGELCRR